MLLNIHNFQFCGALCTQNVILHICARSAPKILTFNFCPPSPSENTDRRPFLWYGAIYTTLYWQDTKIKRNLWICERAERASLSWHFHNLKLLLPSSFVDMFRYFLSETFIFRSQITSAYIKTINALSLNITYGMMLYINDSIPTKHLHWENVWNICERAERASFKNLAFSHSNTAISLNNLLVLQILCFRNIFNFRCQHSPYIYNHQINAVSFYYSWYGAIYKRQYIDKTLTLRKRMCMRASLENFGILHS